MSLSYLFVPDGTTTDLLSLAARSPAYRDAWMAVVSATLSGPHRGRFITMITKERDSLHALAACHLDPTAYLDILEEDRKDRGSLPSFNENPSLFCPIWAKLFQSHAPSAHGCLDMLNATQLDAAFWSWGLAHAQRINPKNNRAWMDRFIPEGPKEAKRKRQAAAQQKRGRVKGPPGGTKP